MGALRELEGQLIVTQTKENHRQIIGLLQQLRQRRGIQVLLKIISLTADSVTIEGLANQQNIPASQAIVISNSIPPGAKLEAWGDAEMISRPYVLCTPGQSTSIQMSDNSHQYIAGYSVSRPPAGGIHFDPVDDTAATTISLELTANPSADGKQVKVVVHRVIRELLGFERTSWKGRPAGSDLEIQSPQFAVTEFRTTTSVPVGSQLLLASPEKSETGRSGASPRELGPSTQSAVKSRSLVLMITPILPKAVTE